VIDTRIIIGLISVLIAMFTMAVLGIQEQDRMATFEASQRAKAIQNGAVIYETACSECHGPQGEGILGRAPALNSEYLFGNRLDEIGYQGTLESYLTLTVAGGRPVKTSGDYSAVMPTWSQEYGGPLREDQVRDVVAFVMNWAPGAGEGAAAAEAAASDDPVVRGRALFTQTAGCAACHTVDGVSTGQVGPNLTNIYAEKGPDYIRESILDPNAVIAEGFAPNIMPQTLKDLLTPEQIDDIIAFLEGASQ
jgi:cbb3-type cytochrome c oxidase subunit III